MSNVEKLSSLPFSSNFGRTVKTEELAPRITLESRLFGEKMLHVVVLDDPQSDAETNEMIAAARQLLCHRFTRIDVEVRIGVETGRRMIAERAKKMKARK